MDTKDRHYSADSREHRKFHKPESRQQGGLNGQPAVSHNAKTGGKSSRCPYSGRCGGCTLIDVPMDEQLLRKQELVRECVGEFGPVEPILRMKNPGRYRNKVTSVFGIDRKRHPVCGVYRAHSHEIIPVSDCRIENRTASAIVQEIFALLPSFRIRVYDENTGMGLVRAVQVRTAHATGEIMVTIVTASPAFPSKNHFVEALLAREPAITTIVQNINVRTDRMILGDREKVLYGKGYIEDILCGKRFRISSRSFYQVNSLQTEKLYHIAVDGARLSGRELILDAYCGTGTIGICAADHARALIGVEQNADAVRDALLNAKANGVDNAEFVAMDAGEYLQGMAGGQTRPDVVFMDPPRQGASDAFLQSLLAIAPKRIVYISCNPVTLGENLAVLCGGYRLTKAVPVDMFPYTAGTEVVSFLERRTGDAGTGKNQ